MNFENRLRNELAHRAEQAPPGGPLAERILAATQSRPARPRRGWPTWALPVLAAGAVAAIVAGVFIGVAHGRHEAGPANPPIGSSLTALPSTSTVPPTRTPSAAASSGTALPRTTPRSFAPSVYAAAGGLASFRVADLTFVGTGDAWAVGSASPLSGAAGRAPAMLRSTDGGSSWSSMPVPTNGAQSIRFATTTTGYAWTPSSLVMTTDGGKTWPTQPDGGALALETFHDNVIRVVATGGVHVETAGVGSSKWTKVALPKAPAKVESAALVRSDARAYVLLTPALAKPLLYESADNGASWSPASDACPSRDGRALDPTAVAASPGGVATVVCRDAVGKSSLLAKSANGGTSFAYARSAVPLDSGQLVSGDPRTVLVVGGKRSYTSVNGGDTWTAIGQITAPADFVGFESTKLGRIVTDGGATIWTTTDAGATWKPFTFPS